MRPWTRPDYIESMNDERLREQVRETLNSFKDDVTETALVDSKFFYSGINASWFFNYGIDEIKNFTDNILDRLTPTSTDIGPASPTAVNSAFTTIRLNERTIKIYTSEYLAFRMASETDYSAQFFALFPRMRYRLGNGAPGEVFEADFLVSLEQCYALAEAESFYLGDKARDLKVLLGCNIDGGSKVEWPAGQLKSLPQNTSNDLAVYQPIALDGSKVSSVLWFIPADKSQPFLDFFVLIPDGSMWELRIVQNTTSKKHEKKSDKDQLLRILQGLEMASFDLKPDVTVAFVVESPQQSNVGTSIDGMKIMTTTARTSEIILRSRRRTTKKEFTVPVIRVTYERTSKNPC